MPMLMTCPYFLTTRSWKFKVQSSKFKVGRTPLLGSYSSKLQSVRSEWLESPRYGIRRWHDAGGGPGDVRDGELALFETARTNLCHSLLFARGAGHWISGPPRPCSRGRLAPDPTISVRLA